VRELSGKVAVVTGGASGIGKAMATRFKAEGMDVVIADIEQGALDATAGELGVLGIQTDVASAESVQALHDAVVERYGTVHVLCNNAGVGGGGAIATMTLNNWRWVINVNLWGVIHGLHSFLPTLLANEDGGHVVNTASVAGLVAGAGIGAYNASKYAVVGISETMLEELAGTKVGVSVLCPGFVRTNIFTSQRNRPAELTDAKKAKPTARQFNDDLGKAFEEQAIDPAIVAGQVRDAIVEDRFWILTHPELIAPVQARTQRLLDAAGQA
jgi:NAD(P)-dependent dehydrogenase (short-subunit alcohol dehydrogenase family)